MLGSCWREFGINDRLMQLAEEVEQSLAPLFRQTDLVTEHNQLKVVRALQRQQLSDWHLHGSTGYGYGDAGREALDAAFAEIMQTEAAIVRPHFVSGTHALACALLGNLRPGDQILLGSGKPYDTLEKVIGLKPAPLGNSLLDLGVEHQIIPLRPNGDLDIPAILAAITPRTRLVHLQRSRGYSLRPALSLSAIAEAAAAVHACSSQVIVFVDNCYGEFVEWQEPGAVGADLLAGSLIKNPGGGLAPSGGYIAGREVLVARAAERLAAPGLGREMGATAGQLRPIFQGLFLAPSAVGAAVKGAIFAAALFQRLGYPVSPLVDEPRRDIIQAVQLTGPEQVIAFCQGVQAASAVDAHVRPEPGQLPGYSDPVIMAAGTFILGASLELSADAPIRPPYTVFLQGGLTYAHAKLGAMLAASRVQAIAAGERA